MSNLAKVSFEVVLTSIHCGECGGTYAINERYREQQYKKGGCWTCPYCKTGWGYSDNNENSRLKKQVEELEQRKTAALARANEAEARAKALSTQLKGTKTKLTNHRARSKVGVCPCCSRTFKQLAAHMANKHPEFTP